MYFSGNSNGAFCYCFGSYYGKWADFVSIVMLPARVTLLHLGRLFLYNLLIFSPSRFLALHMDLTQFLAWICSLVSFWLHWMLSFILFFPPCWWAFEIIFVLDGAKVWHFDCSFYWPSFFQESAKAKFLVVCLAGITLVFYVLGMLFSLPEFPVPSNSVLSKLSGESAFALMSLLGANVMPHNFYLHSSIIQVL